MTFKFLWLRRGSALCLAILVAGPGGALAQGQGHDHHRRASPASTPWTPPSGCRPPAWCSTFDTYQPFADPARLPWRDANDIVHRIGGWRAYAREAQSGDRPSAPASSSASTSASAPVPGGRP